MCVCVCISSKNDVLGMQCNNVEEREKIVTSASEFGCSYEFTFPDGDLLFYAFFPLLLTSPCSVCAVFFPTSYFFSVRVRVVGASRHCRMISLLAHNTFSLSLTYFLLVFFFSVSRVKKLAHTCMCIQYD